MARDERRLVHVTHADVMATVRARPDTRGWPRKPSSHEIGMYRELKREGMSEAEERQLKRAVIRASDSGSVPF
jgi:hypothetical protein